MSFHVGRPMPAWNIPVQMPPPPPPVPYNPNAPPPQFGGYYQPPELITKLYHKLSIIDYELRCPIDLIHLIVKAAMRDPVVAQDLDLLVAQRSQEFRPNPQQFQNAQHQPPNQPIVGSSQSQAVANPQVSARGTPGHQPASAPAQRQAAPPAAAASARAPAGAPAPATAQPSGSQVQAQPTTPSRDGSSSSRESSDSPELIINGVPLHLIKSPRVIPKCPRPAKTAAELRVPPGISISTRGRQSNGRSDVIDLSNDDEAPEPQEKLVDYSKLLEMTEKDLGWHGKYDNVTERRQSTLGIQVAIKIEKLLERLRGYMETSKSFPNRVHILTVMREIIMATLLTEGSRVGREVRNSAYQYDDNFVWAIEKLSNDQRRRLKALEDGKWVKGLEELIERANSYCSFPRLREALAAIDPDAAAAFPEEED